MRTRAKARVNIFFLLGMEGSENCRQITVFL